MAIVWRVLVTDTVQATALVTDATCVQTAPADKRPGAPGALDGLILAENAPFDAKFFTVKACRDPDGRVGYFAHRDPAFFVGRRHFDHTLAADIVLSTCALGWHTGGWSWDFGSREFHFAQVAL